MPSRIGSRHRRLSQIANLTAARLDQSIYRPSFVPRQQGNCPNGPQNGPIDSFPITDSALAINGVPQARGGVRPVGAKDAIAGAPFLEAGLTRHYGAMPVLSIRPSHAVLELPHPLIGSGLPNAPQRCLGDSAAKNIPKTVKRVYSFLASEGLMSSKNRFFPFRSAGWAQTSLTAQAPPTCPTVAQTPGTAIGPRKATSCVQRPLFGKGGFSRLGLRPLGTFGGQGGGYSTTCTASHA